MARCSRGPRSGQAFPREGREEDLGLSGPPHCKGAGRACWLRGGHTGRHPAQHLSRDSSGMSCPDRLSQVLTQYPCPGGPSQSTKAPVVLLVPPTPTPGWQTLPPVLGLAEPVGTLGIARLMPSWALGSWLARCPYLFPSPHARGQDEWASVPVVTFSLHPAGFYNPTGWRKGNKVVQGSCERASTLPPLGLAVLACRAQAPPHYTPNPRKGAAGSAPARGLGRGSEEAGSGLARRVVVPDVLQDVHLVHGLDLLLLLLLPGHGLRWARSWGDSWLSG